MQLQDLSNEKIFIKGGLGFIGFHLMQYLYARRCRLLVLDLPFRIEDYPNLPEGFAKYVLEKKKEDLFNMNKDEVEIIQPGEVTTHDDIVIAYNNFRPDVVIHLAAWTDTQGSDEDPWKAFSSNIGSLMSALEMCVKNTPPGLFIYASSDAVYGDFDYTPVKEVHPKRPKGIYGVTKLMSEELLQMYATRYNLPSVVLRFCLVYGPGDLRNRVVTRMLLDAMIKKKIVIQGTDNKLDFTYVSDVVEGITKVIELGGPPGFSVYNMSRGQGRLLPDLGDIIMRLVPRTRAEFIVKEGVNPLRGELDISAAAETFCYQPVVNLEEGVGRCHKYLKDVLKAINCETT